MLPLSLFPSQGPTSPSAIQAPTGTSSMSQSHKVGRHRSAALASACMAPTPTSPWWQTVEAATQALRKLATAAAVAAAQHRRSRRVGEHVGARSRSKSCLDRRRVPSVVAVPTLTTARQREDQYEGCARILHSALSCRLRRKKCRLNPTMHALMRATCTAGGDAESRKRTPRLVQSTGTIHSLLSCLT